MTNAQFGTLRTLKSGSIQARYTGADDKQRTHGTHKTERDARKALALVQADFIRQDWTAPERGQVTFAEHAERVSDLRRSELAPGTQSNNASILKRHLLPAFGNKTLSAITVEDVDRWWGEHADNLVQRRNSYCLLTSLLKYAVRWGHIKSSPCMVEKAGKDEAEPRPDFTVSDLRAVLAHVALEYGPVLWCSLVPTCAWVRCVGSAGATTFHRKGPYESLASTPTLDVGSYGRPRPARPRR